MKTRLSGDPVAVLWLRSLEYIRDFDRLAETTTGALNLYNKMLELYPSRFNPAWALWSAARAVTSAAAVP